MQENRLDKMKEVPIDEITPKELVTMQYSKPTDCLKCPKCHSIIDKESETEWGVDSEDYEEMDYEDYEDLTEDGVNKITCPNCNYTNYANKFPTLWTEDIIEAPNCEEYVPGITRAYEKLNESKNEVKRNMTNVNKSLNLTEATIKALYDGLNDTKTETDVEGIIDDVLVVTDPEITTDEYNELIDRAQEIVEDTPEGDIPLDSSYLGEYAQICPICGGTFIADHVLEPGTACPICYETPESFVMLGKLSDSDTVAQDNGISAEEPTETVEPVDAVTNATEVENNTDNDIETVSNEKPIEEPTETEEPVASEETTERPRGARRQRVNASKEINNSGNVLTETKKLNESKTVKVSFYVDTDEMPEDKIIDTVKEALKGTGLASYKQDIEVEDVLEETTLQEAEEPTIEKNYTVNNISDVAAIRDLPQNIYVITGMDTSENSLEDLTQYLVKTLDAQLPIDYIVWSGDIMNALLNISGEDAYPEDCSFVAVNLNDFSKSYKIYQVKAETGAKQLKNIINNK